MSGDDVDVLALTHGRWVNYYVLGGVYLTTYILIITPHHLSPASTLIP
jgi:hypothetical protein